jgi:hypothetical protein
MTYPPPPGQPSYPQQAPAPRKRSKLPWILAGIGVVVLLCCGGGAIVALSNPPADDSTAPAAPDAAKAVEAAPEATKAAPKQPAGPGLGDPARDGKFEFVVKSVSCGKTRVGNSTFGEDAQGVFCQVKLTVKNIGDKAQLFDGSSQKAFDAKDTEFSNDAAAELYAGSNNTFLQEINPGNAVAGTLLFDVPKGTKLVRMELHDSAFSGGVQVRLS